MKKLILGVFCFFSFVAVGTSQLNFGAGASFAFDGSNFGIQGKVTNEFSEKIKGHGAFTYFFEKDGLNVWAIDGDIMFKGVVTIGDDIQLNPFTGLNIAHFSGGLAGFSTTDLGINLGASFLIPSGDNLIIYVEPKFVLDGLDSFVLSGGVMF